MQVSGSFLASAHKGLKISKQHATSFESCHHHACTLVTRGGWNWCSPSLKTTHNTLLFNHSVVSNNTYQVSLHAVQAGDWVSGEGPGHLHTGTWLPSGLNPHIFSVVDTGSMQLFWLPVVAEDVLGCLFPSYFGTVGSTETCRFPHYLQAIHRSLPGGIKKPNFLVWGRIQIPILLAQVTS